MSQKYFSQVMGWILAVVAGGHALRLLYNWPVVINNWSIPMWISGVAVVVTAYLSYQGFRLSK